MALPMFQNLNQYVQANKWNPATNPGAGGATPSAVSPATYSSMFGSGMFADPNALSQDYTQKYAEAKQANEGRYAQGMQGYGDLHNRAMGNLANLSNQNATDIRNTASDQTAANNQRMTSLGLGGTTVGSTLNNGVNREMNASLNRNADENIKMQNDTDASTTGAQLGFLERRSDPYPDLGAYSSLMASMGKATGMGGGAGAAGGAGAGGIAGPSGANMGGYGSTIQGDMGAPQSIMTKDQFGNNTYTSRTPAQQKLAANPMYLDSAPPGMFDQTGQSGQSSNPTPSSARWGAPPLNYQQMYGQQGGIPGVNMMQRQQNGGW